MPLPHRMLVPALLALLLPGLALVTAPAASAGTGYAVGAHLGATDVTLGGAVRIHGRVRPWAGGARVVLQVRRPGTTWTKTRATRLDRRSTYSFTVRPTRAGTWQYRVVKPRGSGHGRGASPARTLTVWRWRPLSSLRVTLQIGRTTAQPSMDLNGVTFSPALQQDVEPRFGNAGIVRYALGRACAALDTWVGVTPGSSSTAGARAQIATEIDDGTSVTSSVVAQRNLDPTLQPAHLVVGRSALDGADSLVLRVDLDRLTATIGWGEPRVYCAF